MRIAIFGHSYVRDLGTLGTNSINIRNSINELVYFSFPGACFNKFLHNTKLLNELVACKPDVVIVILGGNDIKVQTDLDIVKSDCQSFYLTLKSALPSVRIIASQIEHRHLETINRYGTPSATLFKKLANSFNRWLVRQPFKDKILILNGAEKLSDQKYFKADGTHLNIEGLSLLINLIVDCVE